MATKKTSKKDKSQIVVTKGSVVVALSEGHMKKAEECLQKSGEIKITLKEISVTKLPRILDNGVLID